MELKQHQRRIHESLQGLKGIEDIVHDILYVGEGDTYENAFKDHDRNLIALLERCREKNIKLNPKKLQLRKQEVPYIGHVLTPDGLKPDPSKVKAIVTMPTPSDKKAMQRVLGMITYLAKFLPNLSDVTEPLRRLLDKDVQWPAYSILVKSAYEYGKKLCSNRERAAQHSSRVHTL